LPVATNAANCNSVQPDPNANPQRLRPAVCAGPCAWVVSGSHASVRPVGKKNNQTGRWRGRNPARTQIVPVHEIRDRLMTRFGDVRYWIESRTHSPDEIALRFHHRLVFIHPFSNGNGRHARLIADVLITKLGRSSFTWGSANLVKEGEARTRYLEAIRAADDGDIQPLLKFARSQSVCLAELPFCPSPDCP